MQLDVNHNGKQYLSFDADTLRKNGIPDEIIEAAVTRQKWLSIRTIRNAKLAATDWTQVADAPLSTEQQQAWAAYRLALRDITTTFTDPDAIVWPTEPTA